MALAVRHDPQHPDPQDPGPGFVRSGHTVPAHTQPLTFDDLQRFPDDGLRYEIVDGVLLVTPAPNHAHQRCVANLLVLLHQTVPGELEALTAPFDWKVDESTCLEPDLLVFRRADVGPKRLEATPVLAVEVRSPSTARRDRGLKLHAYEDAGLPWYWIVDPHEPRVTVFELVDGRFVERADVAADEQLALTAPFPVTLTPTDLLR
jgi:Uma2 family endonuclease